MAFKLSILYVDYLVVERANVKENNIMFTESIENILLTRRRQWLKRYIRVSIIGRITDSYRICSYTAYLGSEFAAFPPTTWKRNLRVRDRVVRSRNGNGCLRIKRHLRDERQR